MSETFDVAHINHQGVDVILVVVSSAFGTMSTASKNDALSALQVCARAAGLRGTVVAVWNSGGRVMSVGPTGWEGFQRSLTWPFVAANINRKLTCG